MLTIDKKLSKIDSESTPRVRLNIKTSSYKYRDLHVKDKMVTRPHYL